MKKLIALIMLVSPFCSYGYYVNQKGESLSAKIYQGSIYIYQQEPSGEEKLFMDKGLSKTQLSQSLATASYGERFLIGLGSMLIPVYPFNFLANGAITMYLFDDDHSHFFGVIPSFLSEKFIRSMRVSRFLSDKPYMINEARFQKMQTKLKLF